MHQAASVLPISISSESVMESLEGGPVSVVEWVGGRRGSKCCEGLPGHCKLSASLALSSLAVGSSQTICSFWDGSVFTSIAASLGILKSGQNMMRRKTEAFIWRHFKVLKKKKSCLSFKKHIQTLYGCYSINKNITTLLWEHNINCYSYSFVYSQVSCYLSASRVRLFPMCPNRLASGVWGPESIPPDPNLLILAEDRLPDVSLVADMISCSCLCRFSPISRFSDISAQKRW